MTSDDRLYSADIQALAQAGGLCPTCGGVHALNIEIAILSRVAELPLCLCDGCQVCTPFWNQVALVMGQDTLT